MLLADYDIVVALMHNTDFAPSSHRADSNPVELSVHPG